jgi:uncharacterized protein YkwD
MLGMPIPAALQPRLLGIVSALAILAFGVAAPAPAEAASARLDRQEKRVVRFINSIRRAHGLPGLKVSRSLNRAANYHSWEMVVGNFFAHSSRNGTSSAQRVRRFKRARRVGENLAYVPGSSRTNAAWTVVEMWMNSPGHRAVLLSPGFRRLGVARKSGSLGGGRRGIVFTADFTSRR